VSLVIEIHGLELHGRHGVLAEEREHGQTFLFDLWIAGPEVPSDRIEEALDYRAVVELVRETSDGTQFRLLEALAAAVADAVVRRFDTAHVKVRVRKPEVRPAGMTVDWTAVTVERP
jgi:7,8-dihydroneopterin aldolase/epimerase/oxygenase